MSKIVKNSNASRISIAVKHKETTLAGSVPSGNGPALVFGLVVGALFGFGVGVALSNRRGS